MYLKGDIGFNFTDNNVIKNRRGYHSDATD